MKSIDYSAKDEEPVQDIYVIKEMMKKSKLTGLKKASVVFSHFKGSDAYQRHIITGEASKDAAPRL